MEIRFDQTKKENWSIFKMREIAEYFGYSLTDRFKSELNSFILNNVIKAKLAQFIGTFAKKHFEEVRPPLEKIK